MTVNTNGEESSIGPMADHVGFTDPTKTPVMVCGFSWNGCLSGKEHRCGRITGHATSHVCGTCRLAYLRETIHRIVNEVNYIDP